VQPQSASSSNSVEEHAADENREELLVQPLELTHTPSPRAILPSVVSLRINMPAAFDTYEFSSAQNPCTRVPKFSAFKDRALFDRIKDLPRWQQMQELTPWFRTFDVVIVYLRDVEGYKAPEYFEADVGPDRIASHLHSMGYSKDLVYTSRFALMKLSSLKSQLSRYLTFLQNHVPTRVRVSLPTGGLPQVTLRMAGPVTREFTGVNQTIPTTIHTHEKRFEREGSCLIPRIELFQDEQSRLRVISQTWSRLRLLDPTLLPWSIDETIAAHNPQVLHKDHLMQLCYPAFWTTAFEREVEAHKIKQRLMESWSGAVNTIDVKVFSYQIDLYPEMNSQPSPKP